jgi:hypothetical protein
LECIFFETSKRPYGLAAICGEAALIEAGKLGTFEKQMAAACTIKAPHNVEEGRFPAAGRSEQDDHFGGPDFKVDTAQCAHFDLAARIHLGQGLRGEDFLIHDCLYRIGVMGQLLRRGDVNSLALSLRTPQIN